MKSFLEKSHVFACGFFIILFGLLQLISYSIVQYKLLPYHCNDGIAFGIVVPSVFFVAVWLIIMSSVLYGLYRERSGGMYAIAPYLCIITGAMSNITDRFVYGCVVDYIALVPWNIFNIADVLICVGVIMLLWNMHKYDH